MKPTNPKGNLDFVMEMDRLKGVLRQTLLHDGSRRENTAEHSWHLAVAVMVYAEMSNEPLDLAKAIKMALVHDIVEIDSGDTLIYAYIGDKTAAAEKVARETKAAQRLFGLLPEKLGAELRGLWDAYERQDCIEAKFVYALDRLLPLIANFKTDGHTWKKNGIVLSRVMKHNQKITAGSKKLWEYAESLIAEAARRGYLTDDQTPAPEK